MKIPVSAFGLESSLISIDFYRTLAVKTKLFVGNRANIVKIYLSCAVPYFALVTLTVGFQHTAYQTYCA